MAAILRTARSVPILTMALATAGVLMATSAHGQAPVVGTVTDASSLRPLPGVLVTLINADGATAMRVLTDRAGNYRVVVPRPGRWTLRAEMIGYRTTDSEQFDPGTQSRRVDLSLEYAPIRIDALEVAAAANQQCRRLAVDEASMMADLWYEAKKVLNVVALMEELRPYHFRLETSQRAVSIFSGRGEDDVMRSSGFFAKPFVTASLDSLLQHGWVQPGAAEYESVYYGLDAATVLSDTFTSAYCFRLRTHPETSELVGLAFQPMRPDGLPDISGVLWLDRETAALQRLEFSYTRHLVEPALPTALLPFFGGDVAFTRTADAAWIVSDWTLRMPQHRRAYTGTRTQARTSRPELAPPFRSVADELPAAWLNMAHASDFAVWEQGGSVLEILTEYEARTRARVARMAITGSVWDSTRAMPLAGANIVARGTDSAARTDDEGRFQLVLTEPGTVQLEFTHPRLDTLGVEAAGLRSVDIRRGQTLSLRLAVPSLVTLTSGACDRSAAWVTADDSTAMLRGTIRNAATGAPLAGAVVTARAARRDRTIGRAWTAQTDADERGHFVMCRVPADLPVVVQAVALGVSADSDPVTTAGGDVGLVDVRVPLGNVARLNGMVRSGGVDGPPVGTVDIVIEGPETHQLTSDAQGRFQISRLEAGSYTLSARHLTEGRAQGTVLIDQPGTTYNVELRLQPDAIALDGIEVNAEVGGSGVLGLVHDRIARMRRLGLGSFLTRDEIEGAGGDRLSGLLRRMPGVQLRTIMDRPGHYSLSFDLGLGRAGCRVMAYLDGRLIGRLGAEDSVDELISTTDIELIEVYRRSSEVPAEFGFESGCGVIAIWSRARLSGGNGCARRGCRRRCRPARGFGPNVA